MWENDAQLLEQADHKVVAKLPLERSNLIRKKHHYYCIGLWFRCAFFDPAVAPALPTWAFPASFYWEQHLALVKSLEDTSVQRCLSE